MISAEIASRRQDRRFAIPFIRLFRIEAKGLVPTIHGFYSLAAAYRKDCREMLQWYGVSLEILHDDLGTNSIPVTHRIEGGIDAKVFELHPNSHSISHSTATALLPMKNKMFLGSRENTGSTRFVYAYVGTEDFTMYPLITPGSFLEIDQSRASIASGGWRSEYERPVYLVETRNDGVRVGWCSVADGMLTMHPHPLSFTSIKSYRYPREAEVVGVVTAVSMYLLGGDLPRSLRATQGPHKFMATAAGAEPARYKEMQAAMGAKS